ncbi:sugar phosphate isomerase/epimerase [Leucobacter albus]|uniref:Sugar phosphate isomerase/epimerase n=1 Tax=Leucobacter albus TaxID=272210 RepID=A0ABW3TQ63_9MICO
MLIGAHALVFSGKFDHEGLKTAIEGTRKAGFDLIEIPLMDLENFDVGLARRLVDDNGLEVSASLGLTESTDLSSENSAVVAAGETLLSRCIDTVEALGGTRLCGVIYSAMQKYVQPATAGGRANSQAALSRLSRYAADRGVELSLEVVNRYESNVINTARSGLQFLDGVEKLTGLDGGADGRVSLHLDTYHMNIEEPDMFSPVLAAGSRLGYVHIGESHRGYLGSGSVDFGSFFRALAQIGYDGPVVFESFSTAVVSAELSNTLGVWRNLWHDSDDLAAHANRFIRDTVHAAETIALH